MSSELTYFPPPSGPLATMTRPVATLRHDPQDLADRAGLRFQAAYDDLDVLDWAEVIGRAGRYVLVYHRNAPNPVTEVVISAESQDPRRDVLDALAALHLSERDLTWAHPDVTPVSVQRPVYVREQKAQLFKSRRAAPAATTAGPAKSRSKRTSVRSSRSSRKK